MYYSDVQRYRTPVRAAPTGAQSAYDVLLGMRGMAVTFLFLDLSEPDKPVGQIPGFLEEVFSSSLSVGLAAPMPRVLDGTRFGVEVLTGQGILRFQASAPRLPVEGEKQVVLNLPRQVESVQRRKFSRASVNVALVFARSTLHPTADGSVNGMGHTLDLSAGGIRFVTATPLHFGQYLFVTFSTPDGATYRGLEGKVVRIQPGDGRYIVAVQFSDLSHEIESDLVQTVFRLQLRDPGKR